jgi:hypothetical protein
MLNRIRAVLAALRAPLGRAVRQALQTVAVGGLITNATDTDWRLVASFAAFGFISSLATSAINLPPLESMSAARAVLSRLARTLGHLVVGALGTEAIDVATVDWATFSNLAGGVLVLSLIMAVLEQLPEAEPSTTR